MKNVYKFLIETDLLLILSALFAGWLAAYLLHESGAFPA